MSVYPGVSLDPAVMPDTNSSLITFNVAALQTMMQAVAKEVAERVRVYVFCRLPGVTPVLTLPLITQHVLADCC